MFTAGLSDQASTKIPPANSNPAPDEDHDDGDRHFWKNNRQSVVLFEQPETAVYRNPRGGIVIRQEADGFVFEEDPYVYFSTEEAARKVAAAILRELGDA